MLIARWNFLEADQKYKAALDPTSSDFWLRMYDKEKAEIKERLANLVPRNFLEVFELFDFTAAAIVKQIHPRETAQAEIRMLNALRRGIDYAKADEWMRLTLDVMEAKRKVANFPEISA
jgi:hypothetical protein